MSIVFFLLASGLFAAAIMRNWKGIGSLTLLAPSTVFLGGISFRYALGNVIQVTMPSGQILTGEFNQYVTSRMFASHVSLLWVTYLCGWALTFFAMSLLSHKVRRKSVSTLRLHRSRKSNARKSIGEGGVYNSKIRVICIALLLIALASELVGFLTGSSDRGSMYKFWADQAFRPNSIFIGVGRLAYVGYGLIPRTWVSSNWRVRACIGAILITIISLSVSSGGRGAALYPIAVIALAWLATININKTAMLRIVITMALVLCSVPYLAAYRDSGNFSKTEHNDLIARTNVLLRGVDGARVAYRFKALGRELYACSDAYLFDSRNQDAKRAGLQDINLGALLTPRIISRHKKLEKDDGSAIAKSLMGVRNSRWFPCMSTPGDLYRRLDWKGVFLGGTAMGIVLFCLDSSWIWMGGQKPGVVSIMLTMLPISYVQSGMYGTINALLWQLLWELPKYVAIVYCLGVISLGASKLFECRER